MSGPLVRAFDPPESRFGPGHLGVDFATTPGTPVRAAGDGVVVFAGRVGSGLHVVVRHPGDVRTTDSFLATSAVVVGQYVARGEVVGTSGGTGAGHTAGVLHFSVRVGPTYIDPMLLFSPVDLAAVVHLATPRRGPPAAEPPPAAPSSGERSAIVSALRADAHPSVHPPAWWRQARRPSTTEFEGRAAPSPPLTEVKKPPPSRPPASVTTVVAATIVSVGGLTLARRRWRARGS